MRIGVILLMLTCPDSSPAAAAVVVEKTGCGRATKCLRTSVTTSGRKKVDIPPLCGFGMSQKGPAVVQRQNECTTL